MKKTPEFDMLPVPGSQYCPPLRVPKDLAALDEVVDSTALPKGHPLLPSAPPPGTDGLLGVVDQSADVVQLLREREARLAEVERKENRLNTGHGHVRPRPDGVRARCGGPGNCTECSKEYRHFVHGV